MLVKLHGVRGSLPAPMRNEEYYGKIRDILIRAAEQRLNDPADIDAFIDRLPARLKRVVGGDTTCISVEDENGDLIIVDCGTGIRPLGDRLLKGKFGRGEGKAHIFFTHTHWDHIQGLPFFKPLYIPGNEIHFYSPLEDLQARLEYQTEDRFFPAPFMGTGSTKHFHKLDTGSEFEFTDNMKISCHPLKHPGGSIAYKFVTGDGIFIFATDAEFSGEDLLNQPENDAFFKHADLLILDAQYTLDESFMKIDWGHTSYTMAVNCAVHWKVKRLALTHHEPAYPDSKIYENYKDAVRHRLALNVKEPRIYLAEEGAEYRIEKSEVTSNRPLIDNPNE